jgi:hypothetical protein
VTDSLHPLRRLKLEILEKGIAVEPAALAMLTAGGERALVEHDYVTTGGLTLVLDDDIYVNAPVDYAFCDQPAGVLRLDGDGFALSANAQSHTVSVLPLPAYLSPRERAPHGIMTHADRVRISPIDGCACRCRFCDWQLIDYATVPLEGLMTGLRTALDDPELPPRHVLVSGGTPRAADRTFMDEVYLAAIRTCDLPVDVMLMPRQGTGLVDQLIDAGVTGFSVNLEIYSRTLAARLCPQKEAVELEGYAKFIEHAVGRTGGRGSGRVRSLLLLGLEPLESTLDGVRFLAELGCDPVLSPFRPAQGTVLANEPPPSAAFMEEAYLAAREIATAHGVELGPRCIPCQHNTITFPEGDAYYRS